MLLIAGLVIGSQGSAINFSSLSSSTTTILVLAAAIRLGVLPPFITYPHQLHYWKNLTTLLYLIPAAAGYILLVRVASSGAPGAITPYLLSLTVVIGIVSAMRWLTVPDEQKGKRYWMVGCTSLAIASALLGQPGASLAWGIASLLSGGLVFSLIIRHRNLVPILILGIFNLSALPFSATWQSTFLYQSLPGFSFGILLNILLIIGILITQSALLAGFIRHMLREVIPAGEEKHILIERWVWTLYPLGLLLVTIIHLLIGILLLPSLINLPIYAWIIGPFELLLSAMLIYLTYRWGNRKNPIQRLSVSTLSKRIFSNEWLYNLVWNIYRLISRVSTLISKILEGDRGIVWALVLFALIFVFLQR